MDIHSFLADGKRHIDGKLEDLTSAPASLPYASLFSSARYSLLASGKRLRPLLALATAASYGLSYEAALVPACAIEMIHTYSLIHDDLPCMDDDAMRRGKPTLHKVFPEWHALLTGDYLLTYAFELLAEAPTLSDAQRVALVRTLAVRSGAHGMIGGQMIDLLCVGQKVDWDLLEKMHLGKTAGLIAASLEFGGIIAGASEADMLALQKTGFAIGIAFQLIDDLLDDTGTEEELGKPIGSDRENFKATAVSVLGSTATEAMAAQLLKTADDNLNCLSCSVPLLKALLDQMVHRRK
jgi:geranylgeranyl diphosphate synthase type II